MFGQYQCPFGSGEGSSQSQTLSFPGAFSVKKKTVPLHQKVRSSRNTNRVLIPLPIVYTSPENIKNYSLSNISQEREELKERFIDNSLENIQEFPENKLILDSTIPQNCAHDSLKELFSSDQSELTDSVREISLCESEMELSNINEQENQNMEVTPPVINDVINFCVLKDIGNQKDIFPTKIKSDIKTTPIHPNWNEDRNTVSNKENIGNGNNSSISTYHNRFTPVPHDVLLTRLSTPVQAVSNQTKNNNIPVNVREESCSKKKIEYQTPDRGSGNARSVPVMMPPPPVPRSRLTSEQNLQNVFTINGKNYEIQFMLGRGGSSKVYQVLDPGTLHQLAVKEVDLSLGESSVTQGYLQEIDLLRKLQGSESVIKMIDYEYIEQREKLYVVMEKGETDLSRLIKEITKINPMPIITILYFWTEMLRAVKDIHAKNIIHSDLKPANFLLVCGRLKLIDFGIASSVQNDMTSVYKDVQTGTFNYISPEALQGTCSNNNPVIKISYKSDIWSLGCILYNLLYSKTPFQHIIPYFAKFAAIINKNHCIEYPATRKDCPPILLYAVKQCLIYDPKKRPTAAELLELPYLNLLAPESCLPG